MSFIGDIRAAFSKLAASKKNKAQQNTMGFDTQKTLLFNMNRQWQSRAKMEVDEWRKAISLAENPNYPLRTELLRIYKSAIMDFELKSALRNALIEVQAAPYVVYKNSKEDETSRSYFEKTWFQKFVALALDTEFYGYSVIDFDINKDTDNQFKQIDLLPREHYRPETSEILKNVHDFVGIPIEKIQALGFKVLVLGEKYELGLLSIAAYLVIRKGYTFSDWSIRNEKFGMPFVWLGTDIRSAAELKDRENMLANFGANSYGIGAKDEELKFFEASSNGNGHLTYLDFLNYADKGIDKLINGQTSTSNDKAFVGAANVHERVMGQYTISRLEKIQAMINDQLIPFLIQEGYPLQGCKFQYLELLKKSKNEPQKKKLVAKSSKMTNYYQNCCDAHTPQYVQLSSGIDDIFERAMRRIFEGKIKAGDIDEELWTFNFETIWEGAESGLENIEAINESEVFKAALKKSAGVFAAFKNHVNTQDMVDALTDDSGEHRTWEAFKNIALEINQTYNVSWLNTEYNFASRSAAMAVEWAKIQQNKDILTKLRYRTVEDARVRREHRAMNGIILPIEHEFWKSAYPPNGWGCRCFVEQTDEEDTPFDPSVINDIPNDMRFNPGIDRQLFSDDHPYFQMSEAAKGRIARQAEKMLAKK